MPLSKSALVLTALVAVASHAQLSGNGAPQANY